MIFPYTSRGVLYAARVITGFFEGTQGPPEVPVAPLLEQAAPEALRTITITTDRIFA